MLPRLPYRIQIPLGLALAVTLSVLLVSVVAAQIAAVTARKEIVTTVQRVMDVLAAQGRPLLLAEDTWRTFALLRNTAALLPGADQGLSRAAILDAEGRFLAGSDPMRLPTGEVALGVRVNGHQLPLPNEVSAAQSLLTSDGSLVLLQPVRSEDEKVIGYVFSEVDSQAFEPDWAALATPALIGAALAVIVLVPLGWFAGRRMARPVAQVAYCIDQIGRADLDQLQSQVPQVRDPELRRIAGAVKRLLAEMSVRRANEQRALSAERLAAVGRITAAVAHEINNPLAGLLTATQTLRLHGEVAETRVRTVDLIERGLHQIRIMTAALLPQARVEERCMIPGDFDDVITLARASAATQSVQVTSALTQSSDMCVPSSLFRQVMLNLLLNAIKAAGEAGKVHATLHADNSAVRFSVANTGAAMSVNDLALRLQAEGGNDPHGFGLWICRESAVRYGGGFGAAEAATVAPPFQTSLTFWLPNYLHHERKTTAVD